MFNVCKFFFIVEKIKILFLFLIDFGILFFLFGCFIIKNLICFYFECV